MENSMWVNQCVNGSMRVKILLCMGGMKSKAGENFEIHFSFFLFGQFVEVLDSWWLPQKVNFEKVQTNFRQRNKIPDLIQRQIGGIFFNFSAWTAFCRVLRMTSCAPVPFSDFCLSVCPYCYSHHHWSGACHACWNYCSRACCCSQKTSFRVICKKRA